MSATRLPRPGLLPRGLLSTSLLSLFAARAAHAETSVTFKNQSWQEDDKRIRVDSQYGLLDAELSPDARLKVMGLIDTIAGATPTGEKAAPGAPVPLARMEDERKAWDANLSYQFKRVNVAVGYGNSRESDYVSNGSSINTVTDFNQKNTTLLLGWGHTDDRIMNRNWARDRAKTSDDLIVGLTQLLDPATQITVNFSVGRSEGYLADPYKLVSKTVLFDPGVPGFPPIPIPSTSAENRPGEKEKAGLFLGANHRFERLDAALDASYRIYHDDFGVTSHTVALEWFQNLGPDLILRPGLRYYRQSAADFYYYDLDRAGVFPHDRQPGRGPFYSSDYRLSEMETVTLGLKVIWNVRPWLAVDAAVERYLVRGLDGETPQGVYSDANVVTLGLKLSR